METIQIPKGYVIDTENSNDRQILLKKIEDNKARSWEEYCKKMEGKDSYYFDELLMKIRLARFNEEPLFSEFEDKEEVEAYAALGKLRKFRKDWVGEWKPDYTNSRVAKFVIFNRENVICRGVDFIVNNPMSFPTEEMCNDFCETFKDLLEQAKTLL